MSIDSGTNSAVQDQLREQARKRIVAKRDLASHAVVYVVINSVVILVWAVTGHGYFWPGWLMGAWGIGLLLQAWDVFWRRPITDADIDAEVEAELRRRA